MAEVKEIAMNQSAFPLVDVDKALEHVVGVERLCNKSVLITGATGTIGSFAADALIRINYKKNANNRIYLGGRNIEKLRHQFGKQKNVFFLQYDMDTQIQFDVSVDYVIHAAGNAHPAAFNSNPVGTIMGNIGSTFRLLEHLRKYGGKRLIYISSGEIYGQGDVSLDAFDESYLGFVDVLSPRSCYPLSKRMAENLCSSYWKQYGIESVIVRPCHTYGPCMTETDNRAHAQFFHNAIKGENIVLKSSGIQMRSYNYVADCVSALLSVLVQGNSGESYNLANPESRLTIAELAQKIAIAGNSRVVFEIPDSVDIENQSPISKQVLSSSKVERLGWKPAFSVEEGISLTLRILSAMSSSCMS